MEPYDQIYGYQPYGRQGYGEPDVGEPSPYPDTPEALHPDTYNCQYYPPPTMPDDNEETSLNTDHPDHIHFGDQEQYDDKDEYAEPGIQELEEPEISAIEFPDLSESLGLGRGEAAPADVQRLAELGFQPEQIVEASSDFMEMANMGFDLNKTLQRMARDRHGQCRRH